MPRLAKDLWRSGGRRWVGFRIGPGETYGLLGPNGADKTTTISMVTGLLERYAGEVFVAGMPLTTASMEAKAEVGYVPQDLAIYPDLSAKENLMLFGSLYGMPTKALKARVGEIVEIIGFTDRADDRAEDYSGGMKRRLNIGIGLLHRPQLLLLGEPTVGVDPQSRNAILESVGSLSGQGMAVLYTTHYMEAAERLCDRVGIIDQGQIKAEGSPRELHKLVGQKDRIRLTATGNIDTAVTKLRSVAGVEESGPCDGGIQLLGGAMYPLLASVVIAPGLYQAAHVTPHAWGIEAFYELLLENGGFVDILPYLGILISYALVFYALAVWRLRTVLTR